MGKRLHSFLNVSSVLVQSERQAVVSTNDCVAMHPGYPSTIAAASIVKGHMCCLVSIP